MARPWPTVGCRAKKQTNRPTWTQPLVRCLVEAMPNAHAFHGSKQSVAAKQLRKLWFMKPVVLSTGTPQRTRCKKKNSIFGTRRIFFLWEWKCTEMMVKEEYCWATTVWAVTLRLIRLQCVKRLDFNWTPLYVRTFTVDHTYTQHRLAPEYPELLRKTGGVFKHILYWTVTSAGFTIVLSSCLLAPLYTAVHGAFIQKNIYRSTWRKNPEELNLHQHGC